MALTPVPEGMFVHGGDFATKEAQGWSDSIGAPLPIQNNIAQFWEDATREKSQNILQQQTTKTSPQQQ
ncbi:MAG: hypothetical protein U0525_05895 [Patescibacteria group bacterium]